MARRRTMGIWCKTCVLGLGLLLTAGLATDASAQAVVTFVSDTYLRLDLDGDGLDDIPIPPIGVPTILPLDETSSIVEFQTVASNGLSITTVVDLEGGDEGIDEPSGPIRGVFGTLTVGFDDIEVPVGGFLVGRNDLLTTVPITLVAGPAGFAGSSVDLEVTASIEGTVRYIEPSIAGFVFSTTFVAQDADEFTVKNGTFTDDGNRSGDVEFLGIGYTYNFEPTTNTATWAIPETEVVLSLSVPVIPGAPSADTTVEFKQFNEVASTNFFGSDPVMAAGTVDFEYGPTGGPLISIRAVQPDVHLEVPVPEPGAGQGLAWGAAGLLAIGRRRGRRRAAFRTE